MDDILTRFWNDLVGRLTGPMTFRLILQPVMATLFAILDGIKDAQAGRPPYFWTIFTHPDERARLVNEGTTRVYRVLVLGVVMDMIYQLMVSRGIYFFELVTVVLLLAFLPYVLLRGLVNRLARHWVGGGRSYTP
jgi:hypothetical protein